jgi:ParB family chromosome partitioning protein
VSKQALGRGLKALLPDTPRARTGLVEIPVHRIDPNPSQPRRRFAAADLEELAASIRQHGVLQPLLVSEGEPGRYVLVAGERRWRAARMAGLATVPAVIRESLGNDHVLELALVENLQRRDLTPLEEARAFEQLQTGLGLAQAEIAARVGIDRSTVANALRLLRLPAEVQEWVEEGALSAGHARTLLAFADDSERIAWGRRAIEIGLSVRELEAAAAENRDQGGGGEHRRRPSPPQDPNIRSAEERLSLRLGTKVEIRTRRRGGAIVIRCADQAELMRVYDLLIGGGG